MPCWLAACLDLLSGPFLGYSTPRKLALKAGIVRSETTKPGNSVIDYDKSGKSTGFFERTKKDDKEIMPPCAEERNQGLRFFFVLVFFREI